MESGVSDNLLFGDIMLPAVNECHGKKITLGRPVAGKIYLLDGEEKTIGFVWTCKTCKRKFFHGYESEFIEVNGEKIEVRKFYKISKYFQLSMRTFVEVSLLQDLHFHGKI